MQANKYMLIVVLSDLEQMHVVMRQPLIGSYSRGSVREEWQGQCYLKCGLGASASSRNFLEIQISKDLLEICSKDSRSTDPLTLEKELTSDSYAPTS